jgi:hypothetical protein
VKDVIFSFLTSEEVQLNRIDAEDPEISDYIMIPDTGRLAESPRVCLQVQGLDAGLSHTAKKKCRKLDANIPRKGISGPQSQFPHSCVCERIIYSHDGAAVSARGNMWTDPGNI